MLALVLALQAAASPAMQDSLPQVTLGEALQRAARLDPNYVTALGQVDNAVWARRNAFAVFVIPSVNLSLNSQTSNPPGFSVTGAIKTVWFGQISARYDIFTGGQKLAELTRSAAALDAAHAGELSQRFATALLTESDYYDVLASAELDRVARDRLQRAQQQLAVARARVVSGAAVSTDSLNLRVELARAQVGVVVQASALRVSRLELGRRVGADGPVDAVPLDSAPMPDLPISLADAITESARQGPQYREAAANERAARASYRAQLGAYLPHAFVTFNANAFDTEFFPNFFKQTQFGFGVSFALWDNGQRELAVSRARVNRDVAHAIREDMDRAVQVDVTAAYDTYLTSRATAALAGDAVTAARESFRVQQSRYAAGATTILDLLATQVALSEAEAAMVQARYSTRLAVAGLESILGRRLFTDKGTP
jgi:outer membrane protein